MESHDPARVPRSVRLRFGGRGAFPKGRALFWHFPNNWGPTGPGIGPSSTVRKGDWKLIYYHAGQRFELFNLAEDIGEANNLAANNPAKVGEMAALLSRCLKSVEAQMPGDRKTGRPVAWPLEALRLSLNEQDRSRTPAE